MFELQRVRISVHVGLLKVCKAGGSNRVVLSPVPAVESNAGRRIDFVAQVVASDCENREYDGGYGYLQA